MGQDSFPLGFGCQEGGETLRNAWCHSFHPQAPDGLLLLGRLRITEQSQAPGAPPGETRAPLHTIRGCKYFREVFRSVTGAPTAEWAFCVGGRG